MGADVKLQVNMIEYLAKCDEHFLVEFAMI